MSKPILEASIADRGALGVLFLMSLAPKGSRLLDSSVPLARPKPPRFRSAIQSAPKPGPAVAVFLPSCDSCSINQLHPADLKKKGRSISLVFVDGPPSGHKLYRAALPNARFIASSEMHGLRQNLFLFAPLVAKVTLTRSGGETVVEGNGGEVLL